METNPKDQVGNGPTENSSRKNMATIIATAIICLTIILAGCSKEEMIPPKTLPASIHTEEDESSLYIALNDMIEQYAKVLAAALPDYELRSIIKSQAMLRFDGDYDILATTLHGKQLSNGSDVETLLRSVYDDLYPDAERDGNQFLSSIIQAIPTLQISVPVNCSDWDLAYIPRVVPLYCDFNEHDSTAVRGYDEEGSITYMNIDKEPDDAVIVVSISERIDENGDRRFPDPMLYETAIEPSDLHLQIERGGSRELILKWPSCTTAGVFELWRKAPTGPFTRIATLQSNTHEYVDEQLEIGRRYIYYLKTSDGSTPYISGYASGRNNGDALTMASLKFDSWSALNAYEK